MILHDPNAPLTRGARLWLAQGDAIERELRAAREADGRAWATLRQLANPTEIPDGEVDSRGKDIHDGCIQ